MTKKYILWSFLFLFCTFQYRIEGQPDAAQLKRWVSLLSVKSDFRQNNFRQVFNEVRVLDTVLTCDVFDQLLQIGNKHNKRFLIRMHFLQALMEPEFLHCGDLTSGISISKSGLDLAYKLEDPYLIELGNKTMTGLYRLKEDYGLAIMHLRLVIEAQQQFGLDNFYNVGFDRYALGELAYYTREYEDCIQYMNEALAINKEISIARGDSLDNFTHMSLHNTLGLAYLRTQKHDLALNAFQQALKFATLLQNHEWEFLLQGNMGDVYFEQHQYDTARILLTRDFQKSLASGIRWFDNAANSLQKLARINIHENKLSLARAQLKTADSLLAITPKATISMQVQYGYLELFSKLGLTDSLYFYSTKYVNLHDSLERKAANEKAEIVELRLNNQENINRILSLNKEKKRIILIRNFTILFTVLCSMVGMMYIKRQKLRLRLRHQHILDEKAKAENQARQAKSQLQIFTNHLLEKNNLVESLQAQLMQKELTSEQVNYIQELSQHSILTDEDWERFKHLFEKVYPVFFIQLKVKAPDITLAEMRIAAFSKLNFDTRSAANLLGISPASVNKTRQRLRHRLGLEPEADLPAYFKAEL